jgi:hypothetical protein
MVIYYMFSDGLSVGIKTIEYIYVDKGASKSFHTNTWNPLRSVKNSSPFLIPVVNLKANSIS